MIWVGFILYTFFFFLFLFLSCLVVFSLVLYTYGSYVAVLWLLRDDIPNYNTITIEYPRYHHILDV